MVGRGNLVGAGETPRYNQGDPLVYMQLYSQHGVPLSTSAYKDTKGSVTEH